MWRRHHTQRVQTLHDWNLLSNGCAPQLQSIISSIVFSALWNQGFGIHFINSYTIEIAQLVGFRYVDDCGTIQLDDDIEATHSQIQLAI